VNRVAASLAGFIVIAPAEAACHKFSYWAYPWAQRCPIAHVVARPARVPSVNIPLPTLTSIEWGEAADERTRGMIELKLKLQGD
jgi:hypothetical protein